MSYPHPDKKQIPMKLVVKTFHGLENVLAEELSYLGAKNIDIRKRAVSCEGNKELLYKANLHIRTGLRILLPIMSFRAKNDRELYKKISEYNWSKHLDNSKTFAIDSVAFGDVFKHSQYIGLKAKDAIVDQFRKKTGKRPSIDPENPDISINLHVTGDKFTISLDSSGESLHRRGYRDNRHKAPLNEVLAAGMLKIAKWHPDIPLFDPMCGSGTILMEAAMAAKNLPPAWRRKSFCFMNWPDFDEELWKKIREEAEEKITSPRVTIIGADVSMNAVDITKLASLNFGLNREIKVSKAAFENQAPPFKAGMIITNPPYGERLQKDNIIDFYKLIGNVLKHRFSGYDAWIISSNFKAMKNIGLKPDEKHTLYNGPLETKFWKFKLYEGSMKIRKQRVTNK
jgi:putative N6-adenine-specific DNA methylase